MTGKHSNALGWNWEKQQATQEFERRVFNELKVQLSNLEGYSVWLAQDLEFTDESLFWIWHEGWSDLEGIFVLDDGIEMLRLDGDVLKFEQWVSRWEKPKLWNCRFSRIKLDLLFFRPFRSEILVFDKEEFFDVPIAISPRVWASEATKQYASAYFWREKNLYYGDFILDDEHGFSFKSNRLVGKKSKPFRLNLRPRQTTFPRSDAIDKAMSLISETETGAALLRAARLSYIQYYSFQSFENKCVKSYFENSLTLYHIDIEPHCLEMVLLVSFALRTSEQDFIGLPLPNKADDMVEKCGRIHAKCCDASIYAAKVMIELENKNGKWNKDKIIGEYGFCLLYTSPSPRDRG